MARELPPVRHYTASDPGYPARLRVLDPPPPYLSTQGPLDATCAVAIVGTRQPLPAAATFAHQLAAALAARGAVVVSGGAIGIDASAHRGALDQGGRTWVVAGTGEGVVYPKDHGPLYERVVASGGAMVWPFPVGSRAHPSRFLQRNAVLVALSDLVVIVQARIPSGALHAAGWARRLKRPRWVVCPAPWEPDAFTGCWLERKAGAEALTSIDYFLETVGLPEQLSRGVPSRARTAQEAQVIGALGVAPRHVDEVIAGCGLTYSEVMTALLTLALEDVLVEGPEGFFRLTKTP